MARQFLHTLLEVKSPDDPTNMGKPLTGNLKGYWVYRVGHYGLICHLQFGRLPSPV